ncbi:MAG: NAD(P)/FAD-dependent oxidoreductase [Acidobacteriota bacterium]
MTNKPHVIVIGGGFGGLDAARGLAAAPVRVTLLDRHNYHLFQPLLYQVATASLSPADVASPIRWILRRQSNVQVLLAEAQSIAPAEHRVMIDGGSIDYDYLIVATGAAHAYFGHPEWAARAPGLKTLDDALEIRRRILLAFEAAEREPDAAAQARLLTFVIIGGGPTGVELAGALAEIARRTLRDDFRSIKTESARIVLLEGGPHLLGAFPASLRQAALDSLIRLGVEVRTSAVVTDVTPAAVCIGEDRIAAETVLWAAGVAASSLVKSLGVPLDRVGRVLAEPTLRVPGHPDIFVVGDVCALQQDGKPLPGVAQVAKQGGAHAAVNVLHAIRGESVVPFRYRDYGNMATIGRGAAVADIASLKVAGFAAWLIWLFIHIFWLIGFRSRLAVIGEWAWAFVTFQRRARLITGEKLKPGPRETGPT